MSLDITESLIGSFRPSKLLANHKAGAPITSLDYDYTGQYLISTGVDESIQLYDVTRGKHLKSTYSKKYGCHLARFTYRDRNCVFASTKENDIIRYLNLSDNSFIRYFKGHEGQVTGLEMAYGGDSFVSCSGVDGTVRLWDVRSSNCQSRLCLQESNGQGGLVIGLDGYSCVVAVFEMNSKVLRLQSLENLNDASIVSRDLSEILGKNGKISKIEFLNNGKYILLTGAGGGSHYLVDAYKLSLIARLNKQTTFVAREYPDTGNLTVSPDCRFVIGGNGDGSLLIWDLGMLEKIGSGSGAVDLTPIKKLDNDTGTLPRMVSFNPKFGMLSTADTELCLWLPST
ncbi:hypothetical protein CANARDRAFT_28271 [[Candida] arabinofermentans NRRL YB-2248]|uniref:Uncharacterized protein n=1 Tax=[Candida] arabinofermentans NRRL YB-2248 TaxID=983967 RepID=A0A1E4T149_9ASCO|nr:hypothetical protein CANARDRAFT_28271 [[Candida] arabinofermentans NRRL YB-2248]